MNFSIKDFFNKCDQMRSFLQIVLELKHLSLKETIIRIWYFLWLVLLFDTQLKQDL